MNHFRRKMMIALVCAGIVCLALLADRIPFFVYDETILYTDVREFFTIQHAVRLLPFLLIAAISSILIIGIVLLRRKAMKKRTSGTQGGNCTAGARYGKRSGRIPGENPSRFMKVRWTVMIVFGAAVMFGGIWTGATISGLEIPVLACPTNRQQLMESSCYFLAHLPELFEEYALPQLILFFASTAGFAVLLGRVICGFLCPMGLIQDTMHLIRQRTGEKGITMTKTRYRYLVPVKWLLILLMFSAVFLGGEFCSFCPALTTSPVFAGMQVSIYLSGFVMIAVLVGSFFKRRFWCNICPLGYLIGLLHHVSPFRIRKDTVSCTECGACYEACPMGIQTIYTERCKTDVTDANCIMCGECIRRCPEDNALSMTFAGKRIYTSSREQVMAGYKEIHIPNKRPDTEAYGKV